MRVEVAHTAQLGQDALAAVRALLDGAFDDFSEEDWRHALGGLHVLAFDDGSLAGHASVVMRRLLHGGGALRCGYVEAVAVREDRRRRGVGGELMSAVAGVIARAYDLGALSTTEQARRLYEGCGWRLWRGPLAALTPGGVVPTPEESGGVYVLPVPAVPLDLDGTLTCDWRDGDPW